jgi:hypothetical protein
MIPFMSNVQKRQIYRGGKQVNSYLRMGERGVGSVCLLGREFPFGVMKYSAT